MVFVLKKMTYSCKIVADSFICQSTNELIDSNYTSDTLKLKLKVVTLTSFLLLGRLWLMR